MAKVGDGGKKTNKFKFKKKMSKKEKTAECIEQLKARYDSIDPKAVRFFKDLPLSRETLAGLEGSGFTNVTEVQQQGIALALRGHDILGAAKTGSGKTLAFLVPLLERLWAARWGRQDGAGALVITPTRELAYQIFETLRKVGKEHDFSAGLVIGGKDLRYEWSRVGECNILVCTPGRLLQHLDENPDFGLEQLQVLVLDEADRCLDLGFSQALNSIVAALPPVRQTLLYSATQTRRVQDLARLSLVSPVMVSVHEHSEAATPDALTQSYIVLAAEHKLNTLWSFLKCHRRKKTIVFVASCKQAKFYTEALGRLKPGLSVLGLYGSLHQLRRMAIYDQFCAKEAACLLATDVAARGLDFPGVDWVLQLDCPEDATTYTHRAGRTARLHAAGEALLVVTPQEEPGMLRSLQRHKVPIAGIEVNPAKQQTVERKLAAMLAADRQLKESAQRAFTSYLKSVFLMKDKEVFDVSSVDLGLFAESLGLAAPPRVRFLDKWRKNKENKVAKVVEDTTKEVERGDEEKEGGLSALTKDDSEDEDIFTVKRRDHKIEEGGEGSENEGEKVEETDATVSSKKANRVVTKAQLAKKLAKKKIKANSKMTFDDSGEVVDEREKQKLSEVGKRYEEDVEERLGGGIDLARAKAVMGEEDRFDRATERARIREKHREEKRRKKEENRRLSKAARGEGSGGESEGEEEGSEPDLSWLPDPDQLYGEEGEKEAEQEAVEEVEVKEGKRKKTIIKKTIPKKKAKLEPAEEVFDTGLSLGDDEDLAMRLLRS